MVFVTKYRRDVFTREILDDLRPIFAGDCADFDAELTEFDGEDVTGELPSQGSGISTGEQFERCIESDYSAEELPSHPQEHGGAVVALVFCWALWRCAA